MKINRVWVGLGSMLLAAPGAATAKDGHHRDGQPSLYQLAQAGDHGAAGAHAGHAAKPGEGGEGGEGGGADLSPELRLIRGIELIRGHLIVGNELARSGLWQEALPHFLHPQEEIYAGISNGLKAQNIPAFLVTLKALAQTVKAKNAKAYEGALARVNEKLDGAEGALRKSAADWPQLAIEAVLQTVSAAVDEYEEAVSGERIANIVEYQDSRGFVFEASRLLASLPLAKQKPEAFKSALAALDDMKTAWPSVQPPEKPVRTLGEVQASASRIELALSALR